MVNRDVLFALALFAAFTMPARAGDVALTPDGQWKEFLVDRDLAQNFGVGWVDANDAYSALAFTFTIGAGSTGVLTVVDAGFAGDTYRITNFGTETGFGSTSRVPTAAYDPSGAAIVDFDLALAAPSFSRGVFSFGAGSYRISGSLDQSVAFEGLPLNATIGGIRLTTVTPIPEPATGAMLAAGLGLVAALVRRRRR